MHRWTIVAIQQRRGHTEGQLEMPDKKREIIDKIIKKKVTCDSPVYLIVAKTDGYAKRQMLG